jgi:hypothetical protein
MPLVFSNSNPIWGLKDLKICLAVTKGLFPKATLSHPKDFLKAIINHMTKSVKKLSISGAFGNLLI